MNVLLISFSFPPAGGVGVLRALSLAKYLPESGIRVHVLTARNAPTVGKDTLLLAQIPDGVIVHQTWTPDLPFTWRKRVKALLARDKRKNTEGGSAATVKAAPARPNLLRTLVANALLPDPQVGWIPFARLAAKHIIRSHNIDAVVITVPPFSTLRLTTHLRRSFPRLPIVIDFRDEWLTTTLGLVSFNKNARAKAIASMTEAAAVQDATAVVAVTDAAVRELRGRYPNLPSHRFTCIHNGFDGPLSPVRVSIPDVESVVTLTYMGTVYGSTDPRTFVEAILSLPSELQSRLRVRFVGHIETTAHRELLLTLGDVVELVGFLPQAEALRALQASHYLLLITHDPINVSAKFYDYLGAGKPILAALHPEGDVRRILEQTNSGTWADVRSPAAIAAMMTSAIENALTQQSSIMRPDREAIQSYHRRPLTARYARLLHTLGTPSV